MLLRAQHHHQGKEVGDAQRFIKKNYKKHLRIGAIAKLVSMSERSFIRKFITVTGNKPLQYIQRVRVEAAKRLLEKGEFPVEKVSRRVGYEDFSSFRKVFRKFTSLTPQGNKEDTG